ncbi:MAG: cupin domain-containing protein [Acidobacteriia bacterium]|nr:cupin domain-containing protein [Terriglobia bacterium]
MVDKQTAPHYSWGSGCDGWHLVQTATLSVIEERMPPGTSEVRHYHEKANQFFYVLRGHLSIEVGGSELVLSPGQGVHITAGEPHQVRNRASVDAEFLVVSNPPSHGDRVSA